MAIASIDAGGQVRIGTVLRRAFTVYRAHVRPFVVITFVAALPNLLMLRSDGADVYAVTNALIAMALVVYLNAIAQAVIVFATFGYLRGEPVGLHQALHRTQERIVPILGCTTLYSLGFFAGLVLAVVPGLICAVLWAVALPACAFERLGPIASLRRSARLTAGHRWKTLGIVALLTILLMAVSGLIELVLRPAGAVAAAGASLIWATVSGAYWNCAFVMLYHDLRAAKEGADAREIAAIFD